MGGRNFTWRIEYFGNEEKNVVMQPGDHANHECLCVPMDMYVDYEVSSLLPSAWRQYWLHEYNFKFDCDIA